ncbi:hypothetical protein ANO11243_037380 [Dothideomycetidae sp. 11243]|nr:hypothetical protein ANO11243_037380 [fungal sp. No.11243]
MAQSAFLCSFVETVCSESSASSFTDPGGFGLSSVSGFTLSGTSPFWSFVVSTVRARPSSFLHTWLAAKERLLTSGTRRALSKHCDVKGIRRHAKSPIRWTSIYALGILLDAMLPVHNPSFDRRQRKYRKVYYFGKKVRPRESATLLMRPSMSYGGWMDVHLRPEACSVVRFGQSENDRITRSSNGNIFVFHQVYFARLSA